MIGLGGSTPKGSTIGLEGSIAARIVQRWSEMSNYDAEPPAEQVGGLSSQDGYSLASFITRGSPGSVQPRTSRTDTYNTSKATSVAIAAAREPMRLPGAPSGEPA